MFFIAKKQTKNTNNKMDKITFSFMVTSCEEKEGIWTSRDNQGTSQATAK